MSAKVTTADHAASKVHAFLAAIRVCPSITRAAEAANVRRELHYRRYKVDPVYTKAFDEAWEMGIQALEDDAAEKAMIGFNEPVIYQGNLCYTVVRDSSGNPVLDSSGNPKLEVLTIRRPNPTLHMFMLRGAKPEKYRERYQHDVAVSGDKKFVGTMEELLHLYREVTTPENE